jgi:hypothetical protein
MKNRKPKTFTKIPKVLDHSMHVFTCKLTGKSIASLRLTKDFIPYYSKDLSGYGINKKNPSFRENAAYVNNAVHLGIERDNIKCKQIKRNITTASEYKQYQNLVNSYNTIRFEEKMYLS